MGTEVDEEIIREEIKKNGNTNLITDSGLNTGAQIFAVGDSHTIFFYNSMKIKEHWAWAGRIPATMYTLLKFDDLDQVGTLLGNGHEKYNIKSGDFVMFFYGYNDMLRIKQFAKSDILSEISDLVTHYIDKIVYFRDRFKIIPLIMSIYPNPINCATMNTCGSEEEKILYVSHANQILQKLSAINKLLYMDMYNFIADEKGLIKAEYTADKIHLDYNNKFLRKTVDQMVIDECLKWISNTS